MLSSDEKDSEFTGISITALKNENVNEITLNASSYGYEPLYNIDDHLDGYIISVVNESTISQFGGMFGNSVSTQCTSCIVNGEFNLAGGQESSFGGFAGNARGSEANNVDSMFMNCTFIGDNLLLNNISYVGGITGKTEYVNITNCTVKSNSGVLNISAEGAKYLGGIIGYQASSYIGNSKSEIILSNIGNGNTKIGGVSGHVENDSAERDADISNVTSSIQLVLSSGGTTSIGGIVGEISINAKIEDSVTWVRGFAKKANSSYFGGIVAYATPSTMLLSINNCYAYLEGSLLTIDESGEISATSNDSKGIKLEVSSSLIAGGFIGHIDSVTAVVEIDSSSANGAIWASSQSEIEKLYLGGMIGAWYNKDNSGNDKELDFTNTITLKDGETEIGSYIKNSYTTVALESSQVRMNNAGQSSILTSNNYCVAGIIGRVGNVKTEGKLTTEKVYYSSDYSLALEEKDIFSNTPVNLLSRDLLMGESKTQYFSNDDGWNIGSDFRLPYRTSLASKMSLLSAPINTADGDKSVSLLERFNISGTSLKPIDIQSTEYEFNATHYCYYFVAQGRDAFTNDDTTDTTLNLRGSLNGFVLGDNKTVIVDEKSSYELIIMSNSVVSNLSLQLDNILKLGQQGDNSLRGVLASENSGTIFNVQVDFASFEKDANPVVFAGAIAGENYGNILYCYSTGTIENAGQIVFGGLTAYNEGFIYNSGAVGLITGTTAELTVGSQSVSGIAGVVNTNLGAVYNTFSAVTVTKSEAGDNPVTVVVTNTGYMNKVYFDQYANGEFEEVAQDGQQYITNVSTKELQTAGLLSGNWDIYPMKIDETDADGNWIREESSNYYNYGYPIYHIEQTYYNYTSKAKETVVKKGLFTGNGTENNPYLILNIGTLESINFFRDTSDKSFKLINDITFEATKNTSLISHWIGVGGSGSQENDVYKNELTPAFKGTFSGGYRQKQIWIPTALTTTVAIERKITNVMGSSGLFDAVAGGSISGLVFSSDKDAKINAQSAGALANKISGSVEIKNVSFTGEYVYTGSNIGLVAGIIDSSEDTTSQLLIDNVKVESTKLYTDSSATDLGFIVGLCSGGLIVKNTTIAGGSIVGFDGKDNFNASNVGGIAGSVSEGASITIKGNTILSGIELGAEYTVGSVAGVCSGSITIEQADIGGSANKLFTTDSSSAMGGILGKLTNGTVTLTKGSKYNFELGGNLGGGNSREDDKKASNTGGVVGYIEQGTVKCTDETVTVSVNCLRAQNYAGGLVGKMEAGYIYGFKVEFGEGIDESYALGIGGLAGHIASGTLGDESVRTTLSKSLKLKDTLQAGGLVALVNEAILVNIDAKDFDEVSIVRENGATATTTSEGLGGLVGVLNINDKGSGALTLGRIELKSGLVVKADALLENVGGLFGYMSFNTVDMKGTDTKLEISDLQVTGVKNVGGFVGQYENEEGLSLPENLKTLLETTDGFAKVNLPDTESIYPGNKNDTLGNIGGLFGYYNSSSNMSYQLSQTDNGGNAGGNTDDEVLYVNYNTVLECEDVEPNIAYGVKGAEIKNVGGIAGLTGSKIIKGQNYANIGCKNGISTDDLTKVAYSDVDIDGKNSKTFGEEYLNLINVGGIVGSTTETEQNINLDSVENTGTIWGYEKVGGIIGYVKTINQITFDNDVINSGNINAFTHVGGIIGCSDGILRMVSKEGDSDTDKTSIENQGEITGRTNVGGFVGSVTAGEQNAIETKTGISYNDDTILFKDLKLGGSIKGLINVGGMVGLIDKAIVVITNSEVTDEKTETTKYSNSSYNINITGNTNVGGLIGKNTVATSDKGNAAVDLVAIQNFDSSNIQSFNIAPIEYEYGNATINNKQEKIYYLPTSVGGVIGSATNIVIDNFNLAPSSIIEDGSNGTEVEDKKFKIAIEDVEHQISSVGNYIVAVGSDKYKSAGEVEFDHRSFETMTTGIGGVIGTLNGYTDDTIRINNVKVQVNIDVENGMNVGGYIGYCRFYVGLLSKDAEENPIIGSENKYKPITIVGGMSVGGLFGKIQGGNGDSSIIAYKENSLLKPIEVTFNHVILQQRISYIPNDTGDPDIKTDPVFAEYVGAFAGSSSSIYAIKIDGDIKLDNTLGAYFGGVVGHLEGNMGDKTDYAIEGGEVLKDDVFVASANFNYGGLVGLADIPEKDAIVRGNHNYDFTINTVRTQYQSYEQSDHPKETGRFVVDTNNKTIYMTDHIKYTGGAEISISKKWENYNPLGSASAWNGATNPLIKLANMHTTGWHSEYSLFRTLQIMKLESNKKVTSTIYDAQYIKEVSTGTDGKILYTIYGKDNEEVMYSRVGIATYFTDTSNIEVLKTQQAQDFGYAVHKDSGGYTEDDLIDKGKQPDIIESVTCSVLQPSQLVWDATFGTKDYPFYNFRSERAYLMALGVMTNENYDGILDNLKKNSLKINCYYFQCKPDGIMANRYMKFTTIFASMQHGPNPENDKEIGEFNAYELKGEEVTGWDSRIYDSSRTYSLFDILGLVESRTPAQIDNNLTFGDYWKKNWNTVPNWAKWVAGVNNILAGGDVIDGGLLGNTIVSWVQTWFNATTSMEGQYYAQNYLTTSYEGQYGLIADAYVTPWVFSGHDLVPGIDSWIRYAVPMYDDEGNVSEGTTNQLYAYYSASRPDDINDLIYVFTNEIVNGILETKAVQIPKYVYYNNEYYVHADAMTYQYQYQNNADSKLTNTDDRWWWYQDTDGLYYVCKDSIHTSSLDVDKLFESKKQRKIVQYKISDDYLSGSTLGVDYMQLNYELVSATAGNVGEGWIPIYKVTYNYDGVSSDQLTLWMTGGELSNYYLKPTTANPTTTAVYKDGDPYPNGRTGFLDELGNMVSYTNENWGIGTVISYSDVQNMLKGVETNDYKFLVATSGPGVVSKAQVFCYYNSGKDGLNSRGPNGTPLDFASKQVDASSVKVYKESGEIVSLKDCNTQYNNYYIINPLRLTDDNEKQAANITNYYYQQGSSWFEYDTKYIVKEITYEEDDQEKGTGLYEIAIAVPVGNGDYSENRFIYNIPVDRTGYRLYTRYWHDDSDVDGNGAMISEYLTNNGNYSAYNLSETIMVTFSGGGGFKALY